MELGIEPARLPAVPNATLGREEDIAAAAELLRREDVRLLTRAPPRS